MQVRKEVMRMKEEFMKMNEELECETETRKARRYASLGLVGYRQHRPINS